MGAGGFRKFTSRVNTTMPYQVGFLNKTEEAEHNTSVYDELQKISTSTTHMFQAIDDVQKEVYDRTSALQALNLRYDADQKLITSKFQAIDTQIQNAIGAIQLDSNHIIDVFNSTPGHTVYLTGTLQGHMQRIQDNEGDITTLEGKITDYDKRVPLLESTTGNLVKDNAQHIVDIRTIQQNITTQGNSISNATSMITTIDNNGGKHYQAQWEVKTSIGSNTSGTKTGIQNGVGFVANGTSSLFYVDADRFRVMQKGAAGTTVPFSVEQGKTYINSAMIKAASIGTAQIAKAAITNAQIANGAITFAQIKAGEITYAKLGKIESLSPAFSTANRTGFQINPANASFTMYGGSKTAGGIVLNADGLSVYDAAGVLRVKVGKLA